MQSRAASSGKEGARVNTPDLVALLFSRRSWPYIVVVALAISLWWPRFEGSIDLRWDAGVYYVLGTSLASGHGYRIVSEPGAPEAVQYPPLLPGFVAVCQRLLGTSDPAVVGHWLRISYAALFVAYAIAVLALAQSYLSPILALFVSMGCLLHHSTIFLSDVLFTELPFAFVAVLFVLRGSRHASSGRGWLREAFPFLLATMGFLLRTAGVVLFLAWIGEALLKRKWVLGVVRLSLALIPIVAWQSYVLAVQRSDNYKHPAYEYQRAPYQFYNVTYADNILLLDPSRPELGQADPTALVKRFLGNVRPVIVATGEAISAGDFYWRQGLSAVQNALFDRRFIPLSLVKVALSVLSVMTMAGLILLGRCGKWFFVLVTVGSILLVCTAPWRSQFERYLSPIAPLLSIAALLPVQELLVLVRKPKTKKALPALAVGTLAGALGAVAAVQIYALSSLFYQRTVNAGLSFASSGERAHLFYCDQLWQSWERAMQFIKENTPADAIIAVQRSPHLCYLKTGRRSVAPPAGGEADRILQLLSSVPVSYVVVDDEYKLPAIESDAKDWHLIKDFNQTRLYARRDRSGTDARQ